MKRVGLRLPRPSSVKGLEDKVLIAGFFGGLVLAATAIALIYLPAGLLVAGLSCSLVCAQLARHPGDSE